VVSTFSGGWYQNGVVVKHKRNFLRLRSFFNFGGIILSQGVVPIGFKTESITDFM